MEPSYTVLVLCPHNAAKGLLAAAELERVARERGLAVRVASAGTEPEAGPAPAVVAALAAEGIDVSGHRPRLVTTEDLAGADRVNSMGCAAADLPAVPTRIDYWDEVPPVSQDLAAARAAIRGRVEALTAELARGPA